MSLSEREGLRRMLLEFIFVIWSFVRSSSSLVVPRATLRYRPLSNIICTHFRRRTVSLDSDEVTNDTSGSPQIQLVQLTSQGSFQFTNDPSERLDFLV